VGGQIQGANSATSNLMLFIPQHGLAYLGSVNVAGKRRFAKSLRNFIDDGMHEAGIPIDAITAVIVDGAANM